MFELRLIHLNKLHKKWVNLNADADSLCDDGEKSAVLPDTSQVPGVVWEVSNFGLQESNWCELSGTELELPLFSIESEVLDVVWGPAVLLLVPNTNFDLILGGSKYVIRKSHDGADWIGLGSR